MLWKQLEFRYPENIIFMLIPFLLLLILILGYRKKEKILAALHLKTGRGSGFLVIFLLTLASVLLAISAMGPQIFTGYQEVQKEGLDIYILLDTSKSMLVEDMPPSRLQWMKNIVDRLISRLEGDRVGFIPFSSDAYIQMPLTDDYDLARMFLSVVDTEMIPGGGTNIGAAMNLAAASFQRSAEGDKVILIISDGEEHERASLELLDRLDLSDIRIYAIGVGTEKGGLVPVLNAQGMKTGYKKDQQGEYVISRLEPGILKELAGRGRGAYLQATMTGRETETLLQELSGLKRAQYESDKIRVFKPLYQYFLGTGLLIFVLAYLLLERGTVDEG